MSRDSDVLSTTRKVVLFFDICASTAILEDLLRTDNEKAWRNLLIRLKEFLHERSATLGFEIYKFLGDGWVLLFEPEKIRGIELMKFLKCLSLRYKELFEEEVSDVLAAEYSVGMTFGIDAGKLVQISMTDQREYIGRPLNVAARLQGAIKQKDDEPAGKLLISNNAFASLGLAEIQKYAGKTVTRSLPNVAGGDKYRARKITVYSG